MCLRIFLRFCHGCLGFSVCIFSPFYIKFMYTDFDLGQFSVDDKRGIYCRIDFRYFYLCYYLVKISCTNEPLFNDKIELFESVCTCWFAQDSIYLCLYHAIIIDSTFFSQF